MNKQDYIQTVMQDFDRVAKEIWNKEPRTKYHIIDSGCGGYTNAVNQVIVKNSLVVRHNAGFFSCCSIALEDLLIYFNNNKCLPDEYDRTQQFMYYKHLPSDNLIPALFGETPDEIPYSTPVEITSDNVWFQWSDYKLMNFEGLKPFIDRFFAPSQLVLDRVAQLEKDYGINYEYTVGVFYRGNDKIKECGIADYKTFSQRAFDIQCETGGDWHYLVSPDETEFLTFATDFLETKLQRVICPTQWLHMPKDTGASIFMKLPHNERPEHAINLLASVIMLSKCKHLITHTGNMSFWACLYRGNMNNVHQWREGEWL